MPAPHASAPWRQVRYAVVDLELTGLDPARDEIISFAVVRVVDGRIMAADALYRTVRPRRMPGGETIRIHGLREADLLRAPSLDDVAGELVAALRDCVLVAHVAAIEDGFLRAALRGQDFELPGPILDTARLAAALVHRGGPKSAGGRAPSSRSAVSSPDLGELAKSLGLPVHRPHHAEGDALTTAQVFLALATHLEAIEGPLTLGSLRGLSDAGGGSQRMGGLRRLLARLRP